MYCLFCLPIVHSFLLSVVPSVYLSFVCFLSTYHSFASVYISFVVFFCLPIICLFWLPLIRSFVPSTCLSFVFSVYLLFVLSTSSRSFICSFYLPIVPFDFSVYLVLVPSGYISFVCLFCLPIIRSFFLFTYCLFVLSICHFNYISVILSDGLWIVLSFY